MQGSKCDQKQNRRDSLNRSFCIKHYNEVPIGGELWYLEHDYTRQNGQRRKHHIVNRWYNSRVESIKSLQVKDSKILFWKIMQ